MFTQEETTKTKLEPTISNYVLDTPDGRYEYENLQLLGYATSQRDQHRNHNDDEFMPANNGRCSACRWFEIRIFRVIDPITVGGQYIVHTYGRTIVPDEIELCRLYVTSSPHEIIEFLTVHKNGFVFVPVASIHALAQAAHWDPEIERAYLSAQIRLTQSRSQRT